MTATGFTTSNARVYMGVIVGRSHEVPTQSDMVKYSALADQSYGESIGVSDVVPTGGRPSGPEADPIEIVPCNLGDPCFIVTGGGAVRLFVVTEYPNWQTCEEQTP